MPEVDLSGLLAARLQGATPKGRGLYEKALARVQTKGSTLPSNRRLSLLVLLEAAMSRRPEANVRADRIAEPHAAALRKPLEQALLGTLLAVDELDPGSRAYEYLAFTVLPHLCDAMDELEWRSGPLKDARRGASTARALEFSTQLQRQVKASQLAADEVATEVFGLGESNPERLVSERRKVIENLRRKLLRTG